MTNADRALLLAEWMYFGEAYSGNYSHCPLCRGAQPGQPKVVGGHKTDCAIDLALAERGYATQEDRNRARLTLATIEGAA